MLTVRATILHFVLRLYPSDWRGRYGAEVTALIEDSGLTGRAVSNLIYGAIAEWIALASSPDRRRVWLGRPAGRRLFASAAVLLPLAAMVLSVLVADELVPMVPDDSWVVFAAVGVTVGMLPIAIWRFQFSRKTRFPAGPVGVERRLWFAVLLAMQLATHLLYALSVDSLPLPASWMQAVALLGYFTLPTGLFLTLCLQSAAQRFERATGAPLFQPKRKPSVPSHPLGL